MKTYRLENGKYLGVSYFTNVKNIKWLIENVSMIFKERSPVLINHKLIVDPFQIVVAANNALSSSENDTMLTKCLATEILHNLSSSKKIAQSLRDVSAKVQDEKMVVAIVSKFENVPEMDIFHEKCIKGCKANLSELIQCIDNDYIKSYYGINQIEIENSSILDSIVTRIACKPLI